MEVCQYSCRHTMEQVPAVTVIDCGPVGMVPACQRCADFYERMSPTAPDGHERRNNPGV